MLYDIRNQTQIHHFVLKFGRYNAKMAVVNDDRLIIIGGRLNWLKTSKSTEVYSVDTKNWTKGPLMVYQKGTEIIFGFC